MDMLVYFFATLRLRDTHKIILCMGAKFHCLESILHQVASSPPSSYCIKSLQTLLIGHKSNLQYAKCRAFLHKSFIKLLTKIAITDKASNPFMALHKQEIYCLGPIEEFIALWFLYR